MAKGTIIYMGNFELPDKNAAAHRVVNNGKVFTALGYRTAFLGTVKNESFSGIRQSDYNENIFEEAYPKGTKNWINHLFDTKNIEAVAEKYPDTCLVITYNVPLVTFKTVKKTFAKKNIKVAYDCTEWNDYTVGSLPKRWYKKIDEKQIRTKLHKHCGDIIVISSLMEKQYQGKNLLKLPPLVDVDEPIWHQEVEKNPKIFEFCFAGTVGVKERVDRIVNAFSQLKQDNVRLRIIGITKEEYLSIYPESKQRLDSRITFMGYITHEESIKYLLSSDCYIFMRDKTRQNQAGFPTKFAESYTSGVTVICSDVSDIKHYADEDAIIVENTDEQQIVKAFHIALSKKISTHLKNQFDYRRFIGQTEKWLDNALK